MTPGEWASVAGTIVSVGAALTAYLRSRTVSRKVQTHIDELHSATYKPPG
jgi:hypothetical protein